MAIFDIFMSLLALLFLFRFASPTYLYLLDFLADTSQLLTLCGFTIFVVVFGYFSGLLRGAGVFFDLLIIQPRIQAALEANDAKHEKHALLAQRDLSTLQSEHRSVVEDRRRLAREKTSAEVQLTLAQDKQEAAERSAQNHKLAAISFKKDVERASALSAQFDHLNIPELGDKIQSAFLIAYELKRKDEEIAKMRAKWQDAATEHRLEKSRADDLERRQEAAREAVNKDREAVREEQRWLQKVKEDTQGYVDGLLRRIATLEYRKTLPEEVSLLD
ncbi:MAG: hypothetical protein Q9162_002707 [Coniocarpon cinnabarinum]